MTFPVYFNFFGHRIHPHLVMELIGYSAGFQLYLFIRRRPWFGRAKVPFDQNAWVIVGCIFGALVGSKVLAWLESMQYYWQHRDTLAGWVGGKTIVGGLVGGWAGVEIAKRGIGIRHSTGDAYVFPLCLGISIGRVGCFLTGLPDHTYGTFTRLPWGVDFGDGPRHPTQFYEIAFLLLLGVALAIRSRSPIPNGRLFRLFMLGYLSFRFFVEFLKPRETHLGLSMIQIACATIAIAIAVMFVREKHGQPRTSHDR